MKRPFILLGSLLLSVVAAAQGTYTIHGTLPGKTFNGYKVVLGEFGFQHENLNFNIDSTRVENGKFTFTGTVDGGPSLAWIAVVPGWDDPVERPSLPEKKPIVVKRFILEAGEMNVKIKADGDFDVYGTPLNRDYFVMVTLPDRRLTNSQSQSLIAKRERKMADSTWTDAEEKSYQKSINKVLVTDKRVKQKAFIDKYLQYPKIVSSMVATSTDQKSQQIYLLRMPEPITSRLRAYFDSEQKNNPAQGKGQGQRGPGGQRPAR